MAITKVTNSLVSVNAIHGTLIADNAITSVHIAQNQVTAVQIPDGSITATQLGANSVDSSELVDGSIDTSHIADAQITTAKLGTNQVTSAKIAQNSVEARHIADGSITDTQLGSGAFTMGTITTTGAIRGPASLTIDPATVGDNTGTVVIAGNLQVDGTTTTINSTQLSVADKKITVGKGSGSSSAANESGFEVGVGADGASSNPSMLYSSSGTKFVINKPLDITGNVTATRAVLADGILDTGQAGSSTTFNNGGTTADFIVKSSGNATMLVVDGGANRVGIGEASPDGLLHLKGGTATGDASHILFENTQGSKVFAIGGGATGVTNSNLFFRNVTDNTRPMVITDAGNVGIGTNTPLDLLHIADTSSTNALVSLRAQNSLGYAEFAVQSNYARLLSNGTIVYAGSPSASYFYHSGEATMALTDVGLGIGDTAPFSRLQSGSNTFSGGHGMYADARVGISNHGSLTGMMLASTYNDASHPEYGLVFVQGPSTSSYNVWSISPDGPAKGNGLNFHYGAQNTNIHQPANQKITFMGDGKVGIGTASPDSKLHVVSGLGRNAGGTVRFGKNEDHGLFLHSDASSSSHYNWMITTQDTVNHGFEIIPSDDAGGTSFNTPAFVILGNTRNVGIGTTSPDSKLEVAGMISLSSVGNSSAYDRIKLNYNGYNSGTPEVIFEPGTTPGSGTVNTYFRFINSNGTSTTSNNKANLTIGGNFGISEDSPNAAISIGTANEYVQEWEYAKGFKRNDTGASGANGNYNESTYINVANYRGTCIDYYESGHYFNNGAAYYFRHSRIYVIMESSTLRVADVVLVRSTGNRTDAIVNAPSITASGTGQFTITSTILSGFTHYLSVDAVGAGFKSIGSIG